MGNKLCKRKSDATDTAHCKSPTRFDRIINRLQLRPKAWKSEAQLNQKQVERNTATPSSEEEHIIHTKPLSKSSDWTEVELGVPDNDDIHLHNPKLSLILNNDNSDAPVPPPRKSNKKFREKIEAVAKNGLQAFQTKKVVEEPVCVKKTINYKCPLCDEHEERHNRDHHHHHLNDKQNKSAKNKDDNREKDKHFERKEKEGKRKKNLSVVSLPNYDELKFTIANFDDIDPDSAKIKTTNISDHSLPTDAKNKQKAALDNYITRCRSFGSLLPQQLKKIRTHKTQEDIESDDSFGRLEDWDLGLIEHYNPKDTSLPRPRKPQKSTTSVLSDIESLIVQEEDIPKPPIRKSESLVKKINREQIQSVQKPVGCEKFEESAISKIITPPPSPTPTKTEIAFPTNLPTEEDGHVEHSSLMKILEKFSMLDKQPTNKQNDSKSVVSSNESSLTPSLQEFEKNISANIVDFLAAEKNNTDMNLNSNIVVS